MPSRRKTAHEALEIIDRRYFRSRKAQAELEAARIGARIGRQIRELRIESGLTQRELAALAGTTASVICRLEDDDYDRHSVTMLRRIADALDARVEVRFVPGRS
jgi:DNA-binding XRE family transcriptional regulator